MDTEAQILRKFYSKAKMDIDFLPATGLKVISENNILSNELLYKNFLKKYFELKKQYGVNGSIPKNKAQQFCFEMLAIAYKWNLPKESPILLLIFMSICQISDKKFNTDPCNVLKLKKGKTLEENIHNIYSDLLVLTFKSRLNFQGKSKIFIEFVTFDKALQSCFKLFIIEHVNVNKSLSTASQTVHDLELSITSKVVRDFIEQLFKSWDNSEEKIRAYRSSRMLELTSAVKKSFLN